MKLGLGIGPLGAPGGERMIELAKEGENLGYDTISVSYTHLTLPTNREV